MISSKKKFLFIHIPKTGGNTIQNILKPYSDEEFITPKPHQDGYERFELKHPKFELMKHSTLFDYYKSFGAKELSKHLIFTSVRNPYDRLLSFYFSPHRGKVEWNETSFIEFIKGIPPAVSYLKINNIEGNKIITPPHIQHIIRYENFKDDLISVLNILGINSKEIPWVNKSFHQKDRSLLSQRSRQAIEQYHEIDFNTFDY